MQAAPNETEALEVALPAGQLRLRVDRSDWPVGELLDFAARRNPRRAFLFVSKVLGRHLPVRPSVMRRSWRALAQKLPRDLPGPVLAIGMAETAVALGAGVWEEATRGREDTVYLPSTRYMMEQRPRLLEFQEEHSHASRHLLYWPQEDRARQLLREARTLLLLDDETSTGRTFVNLLKALLPSLPKLEQAHGLVLTNWMGAQAREELRTAAPLPFRLHALLDGEYAWEPDPAHTPPTLPNVVGDFSPKDGILPKAALRLGISRPTAPPTLPVLPEEPGKILVLGTGEFVWGPFRLAEELERAGHEVWTQATTRSPILPGMAVGPTLRFHDNYADRIENFVYNVRREDYDRIFLCTETAPSLLDPQLLRTLEPTVIHMEDRCGR